LPGRSNAKRGREEGRAARHERKKNRGDRRKDRVIPGRKKPFGLTEVRYTRTRPFQNGGLL